MRATKRPLLAAAALAATLALGACVGNDAALNPLNTPAGGGALFQRYVSLGNSITAGYQSGGIVDSLQRNSYANLLAQRANAPFTQPLLKGSGCPQPYVAPLTPGPAPVGTCARVDTFQTPFTSNVAVPGARIADLFLTPNDPTNAFHRLYTLLTGGKSEVQAMIDAHPTFVSAWIGNNDALAAAVSGILGPTAAGADSNLTQLSKFSASADQLGQAIKSSGTQGAVLIGVVFADSAAPILQPGAFFYLARDAAGKFNGVPVNDNCSPVTALGAPNPLSRNLVSFAILSSGIPQIDCSGTTAGGAYVLDANEQAVLDARIAAYNAKLQSIAAANGWLYVNPMDVLRPYLYGAQAVSSKGRYDQDRKCQLLATAATAAQFQAAVLNSCPVTGATAAPNFFGSLISFDGVHPSTAAHKIVAQALAAAINAKYGTSISTS
jgi:hypothetical protein